MAYIHFTTRAPNGFLVVPNDGDPADDSQTILMQSDWDVWGVACTMGFEGCEKDEGAYEKAWAWLEEHEGQQFADLDEYLPQLAFPSVPIVVTRPIALDNNRLLAKAKPLIVHFVWTTRAGKKKRESVTWDDAEAFMLSRWARRERTTAFLTDALGGALIGRIERGTGRRSWRYWWNPSNVTKK